MTEHCLNKTATPLRVHGYDRDFEEEKVKNVTDGGQMLFTLVEHKHLLEN